MTSHAASCPNCGAPLVYRWSSSVQTVCEYCRSIVVRTDVDLKKVGQVADLPSDASPIQLSTEGRYGDKGFVVAGRILYQYEQGTWNEWHIVLDGGADGWLSDAQNESRVSVPHQRPTIPTLAQAALGRSFIWNGTQFTVVSRTLAHYAGVEGELPFEYWDKTDVTFVDLRSEGADFATIDYSDEAPALYIGKAVDFDDAAAEERPHVRGLVRWRTHTVAGPSACAPSTAPTAGQRLPSARSATRSTSSARAAARFSMPPIPASRSCSSTPTPFARSRSFRSAPAASCTTSSMKSSGSRSARSSSTVSTYQLARVPAVQSVSRVPLPHASTQGHWNVVSTINALPGGGPTPDGRRRGRMAGTGTGTSRPPPRQTTFVLGEFPWQIRVGDTTTGSDYVAPPLMLSAEVDADKEVTWSLGQYMSGSQIWKVLALPGKPPAPLGVFANQPSPFPGVDRQDVAERGAARRARRAAVARPPGQRARQAGVRAELRVRPEDGAGRPRSSTPVFELDGRPTAVEIETATNLDNQWMFVGYALVNDETGQAFDFGATCRTTTASKTASRGPKDRRATP